MRCEIDKDRYKSELEKQPLHHPRSRKYINHTHTHPQPDNAHSSPPPPPPPPPPLQPTTLHALSMSEPGPTSIPTSADPRSKRPLKRRALSPTSQQASAVTHLFKNPDREIKIPSGGNGGVGGSKTLAAPPEIVANVQGSSAGAGSGEFHVYKASRRREYERLRLMDEEVRREEEEKEFERKREELRRRDEEKTNKNRKRRAKKKAQEKGAKDGMMDVDKIQVADGKAMGAERDAANGDAPGEDGDTPVPTVEEVGIVIHDDD